MSKWTLPLLHQSISSSSSSSMTKPTKMKCVTQLEQGRRCMSGRFADLKHCYQHRNSDASWTQEREIEDNHRRRLLWEPEMDEAEEDRYAPKVRDRRNEKLSNIRRSEITKDVDSYEQ